MTYRNLLRRRTAAVAVAAMTLGGLIGASGSAYATQVEVHRVHPLNKANYNIQDQLVTLVKYYDPNDGRYRACITSYRDPLTVGSWGTSVEWSDNYWSPKIPLPGEGKTNCTAWRPHHMIGFAVTYDVASSQWFANMAM